MDTPDSTTLKRCTKCGELKPPEAFNRKGKHSDKRHADCKACRHARYMARAEELKAAQRAYNATHKEEIHARNRAYGETHKEETRERNRKYYKDNAARLRQQQREYNQANAEVIARKMREYRAANPEHVRILNAKWKRTPKGRVSQRVGYHNRRAREMAASGKFTAADITVIRAGQTDKQGRLICWLCGKPVKGKPHVEHFIPLSKGGTNDPGNLRLTCAHCNQVKSSKHPFEIGRLI